MQVTKCDFWFCLMRFLSSEIFPTPDNECDETDKNSVNFGSEINEKVENIPDGDSESGRNDDFDEPANCFELLHSNLAPSRRLKPMFFEADTLVMRPSDDVFHFLHTIYFPCWCRRGMNQLF